jgi:hypothetical protein
MLWRYAATGLSSTNRHAKGIHAAGHDQSGAGVSRNWCGSIHHQKRSNASQLRLPWLPVQQQRRHLSWQSPGVLRSFSRPRVSNDNPYSESLFRTAKYRPDYPSRPFASKEEACQWVASFADWYNLSTTTAASSSCRPISATTVMLWRYAVTGLLSTHRTASAIHCAGHERSAVGDSQKWLGSTHRQQKLNPNQLR